MKSDKTEVVKEKKKKISVGGNRKTLGLICILVGLLVFFVIGPLITGTLGGNIEIVRVKTLISAGKEIKEGDCEMVKISRLNLPKDVIKDKAEVIGKYSDAKLVPGDYFMRSKLSNNIYGGGNYLNALDGSKRALSVTIPNFGAGLSAKLQQGDIVSVLNQEGNIHGELKYVKVLAVTKPSGSDAEMTGTTEGSSELPSTITMLVNDSQAKLLTQLDNDGKLHFALAFRGDEKLANQFLEEQESFLNTKSGSTI